MGAGKGGFVPAFVDALVQPSTCMCCCTSSPSCATSIQRQMQDTRTHILAPFFATAKAAKDNINSFSLVRAEVLFLFVFVNGWDENGGELHVNNGA